MLTRGACSTLPAFLGWLLEVPASPQRKPKPAPGPVHLSRLGRASVIMASPQRRPRDPRQAGNSGLGVPRDIPFCKPSCKSPRLLGSQT